MVSCKLKKKKSNRRLVSRIGCLRSSSWSKLGETYDRAYCDPAKPKGKCRLSRKRKMLKGSKFVQTGYGHLCKKMYTKIMKPKGINYAKMLRYIKICGIWDDIKTGRKTEAVVFATAAAYINGRSKAQIESEINLGTCVSSVVATKTTVTTPQPPQPPKRMRCPTDYPQYCPISSNHPYLGGKCVPSGESCTTSGMASKLSNRDPFFKVCTINGTGDDCK